MKHYNELDPVQQAKAVKMAFDDMILLVAEGFVSFNENTEMGKHIAAVVEICKNDPVLDLKEQLAVECGYYIQEYAEARAEYMLYDLDIFEQAA